MLMRATHDYSTAYGGTSLADAQGVGQVQPLDAALLSAETLSQWSAGFRWPVSDAAFDGFASAVAGRFRDAVADAEPGDAELLFADFGFVGFLIQHFHIVAAAAAFQAAGTTPRAGAVTAGHLDPEWDKLAVAFQRRAPVAERIRLAARGAAKGWLLNRHAGAVARVAAAMGGGPVAVAGSFSPLMADMLAGEAMAAHHIYVDRYLAGTRQPAPISARLEAAIDDLLGNIAAAGETHLGATADMAPARACWRRRLADLAAIRPLLDRTVTGARGLFLANLGNPLHRLMAAAWRAQGREVVGFHHGNTMGELPNPMTALAELDVCDTFVTPTAQSVAWFARIHDEGPHVRDVRFVSADTSLYRDWRRTLSAQMQTPAKTVMVVGFPLSWLRYPAHAAHFALLQLDLEFRLVAELRAQGYRVLMKVHPEWRGLATRLWDGHADEVLADPMEACWQRADAFVFPRTSSTTFGFCLCTDRPVVVLDVAAQAWHADARDLLARRCAMVPAHVDGDNRVRFDRDALLAALAQPATDIDYAFVEQAMYPAAVPSPEAA